MRFALVVLALVALPSLAAPPDISGQWTVTSTETTTGTCNNKPGQVFTHIWIVTVQPDGTMSVVVQGETGTPKLDGKLDGNTVTLYGYTEPARGRVDVAWLSLAVKGKELVGVRRFMTMGEVQIGKKAYDAPCFLDLDVKAKR
jgi:hypothetical protein